MKCYARRHLNYTFRDRSLARLIDAFYCDFRCIKIFSEKLYCLSNTTDDKKRMKMTTTKKKDHLSPKRIALVTGATGGIGRGICQKFHDQKYFVFIGYKSRMNSAHDFAESIGCASALSLDVTDPKSIHKAMKEIEEKFGRLDVLVNNAGVLSGLVGPLEEITENHWRDMLDVHLMGAVRLTVATLPLLRKSQNPRIVNIASVHGISGGRPGLSSYATAKAALIGFTKAASRELAPKITVNAVSPGFVDAGMAKSMHSELRKRAKKLIPMHRFASAKEIGNAVSFLASENAGYITGHCLIVSGGRIDLDVG